MHTQKHHLMMLGEIGQSSAINRDGFCLLGGDLNMTAIQNTLVYLR